MTVADEQRVSVNAVDIDDAAVIGAVAEGKAVAAEQKVQDAPAGFAGRVRQTRVAVKRRGGVGVEGGGQTEGESSRGASESRFSSRRTKNNSTRGSSSSESEGGYPGWRLALRRLASSEKFKRSVLVLIVLNTLVLALDHHPMEDDFSTALDACNLVFTLFFTLEMVIKVRVCFRAFFTVPPAVRVWALPPMDATHIFYF